MAHSQSPPALLWQIQNARNHAEQIELLRQLKDEVIGDVRGKEKWVNHGILQSLVHLLQQKPTAQSPSGLGSKEAYAPISQTTDLPDDDRVRLLALQLIASFAKGGPSFLAPLNAVGVVPVILTYICPRKNPAQLVLTSLRALSDMTEAASLSSRTSTEDTAALAKALFVSRYIDSLCAILDAESTSSIVQEQKCLVASLISRLCKEPRYQDMLADAGVLDALATLLASFVVARGEVLPFTLDTLEREGLDAVIPQPAPRGLSLALILEAISVMIADSRFRTGLLLCSPAIMAVLISSEIGERKSQIYRTWEMLKKGGLTYGRPVDRSAIDYLLPAVPVTTPRFLLSQHPPSFPSTGGSLETPAKHTTRFMTKDREWLVGSGDTDEPESPLIPWLIHLMRSSTSDHEKVMAASVLASLFKGGFTSPDREFSLSVLVVPVLCHILKDYEKESGKSLDATFVDSETATAWAILERTPAVLARLIADSVFLQQITRDSGALKLACKLLKDSYEPSATQSPPRPWTPNPEERRDFGEDGFSACQLGPPGQVPACAHKIRMRESSLKLITSLATFKEEFRKEIVEQDILPSVAESLSETPQKPTPPKEKPKMEEDGAVPIHPAGHSPYGHNPTSVLIAACHAVRTLARSVSNLRTALDDNCVAMPIFKLLKHVDIDVKIAACSVICNLLIESSPMRDPLIKAGVIGVLCQYAKSDNSGLRLNALWALKHLVHMTDRDTKKQCLEELGPGWLIQLICDDTEDEALHARVMGERRHLTDADEDEVMDTDDGYAEATDDIWQWQAIHRKGPGFDSTRMRVADGMLRALREREFDEVRKAREADLAIQEQGLDFIRNLISIPNQPAQAEMVDYVFSELGQDRLFDILASKLRVKVLRPFARRQSSSSGTPGGGAGSGASGRNVSIDSRVLYPQSKIIVAVIYFLTHIAAGVPRHRQLVIAQTELLKLLAGHFNDKDVDVRRSLCHLLKNLVWCDGAEDRLGRDMRVFELEKLGFLQKLEGLERNDAELDVRERAKEAASSIKGEAGDGPQVPHGRVDY
ncbi:armadillo-type protein [Neurospora tetraspora]|uniref:Armadillo-type protein n=1 Tax=Neurospora tetraspora TaxID=94610 RepID=A0AAE0MRP5_9PEZI|nr:armadillo-type protein [Neurospora tetraspora]